MLSRRVLYLAVLFHDIAKGRPGDHSKVGAEIAHKLCPRLGLDANQTDHVAWLVEQHLTMSTIAQSRDLNDRRTIVDFAAVVQTMERLRMLLILTVADIRSVGPGVWNGCSPGHTLRIISMPGSWPVAWMVIMRPPGASAAANGASTVRTLTSTGWRAR